VMAPSLGVLQPDVLNIIQLWLGLGLKVSAQSYLGLYYMNIYHWKGLDEEIRARSTELRARSK
jgi:hypothetical protein